MLIIFPYTIVFRSIAFRKKQEEEDDKKSPYKEYIGFNYILGIKYGWKIISKLLKLIYSFLKYMQSGIKSQKINLLVIGHNFFYATASIIVTNLAHKI